MCDLLPWKDLVYLLVESYVKAKLLGWPKSRPRKLPQAFHSELAMGSICTDSSLACRSSSAELTFLTTGDARRTPTVASLTTHQSTRKMTSYDSYSVGFAGDVLMHCVTDALLGALSLPDIGQLFPDNKPEWKGAASHVFLSKAVSLMDSHGYKIGNLDATIILQRPKLSPHKAAIVANLCELLQATPDVVNVKAKTHEKVDSLGENRSIACHSVVLLVRK